MTDWTLTEGTPIPLGATWVEGARAWNFALYSKHAQDVTLLLYTEGDRVHPVATYRLKGNRANGGWYSIQDSPARTTFMSGPRGISSGLHPTRSDRALSLDWFGRGTISAKLAQQPEISGGTAIAEVIG